MSTPFDDHRDGPPPGDDPRTKYAPRWARHLADAGTAAPSLDPPEAEWAPVEAWAGADEPAFHSEADHRLDTISGGGERSRWSSRGPVEGDIAIREARGRPSLEPELVPAPRSVRRTPSFRMLVRWAVLCAAVVGFAGVVAVSGLLEGGLGSWWDGRAASVSGPAPASGLDQAAPVRLVLVGTRRAAVDQPVALAVSLSRPAEGSLAIGGLAAGTRLTTGGPLAPNGWLVPLAGLADTAIVPPRGFSGVMGLALELRRPDHAVLDRGAMRVTWGARGAFVGRSPAAPGEAEARLASVPMRRLDPDDITALRERGTAFVARGDLGAARLLLRRAAEAGDAEAALLLGSTYDPVALKQLEVMGTVADTTQARLWYQRAGELGSADAGRRLDGLAREAP